MRREEVSHRRELWKVCSKRRGQDGFCRYYPAGLAHCEDRGHGLECVVRFDLHRSRHALGTETGRGQKRFTADAD